MMLAMADDIRNVFELLRLDHKFKPLSKEEILDMKRAGKNKSVDAFSGAKADAPLALPFGPSMQSIAEGEFVPLVIAPPNIKTTSENNVLVKAKAPAQTQGFLQRDYVKYPLIFAISFAAFFFILNFGAFSDKIKAWLPKSQPAPETQQVEGRVLGASTPEYTSWVKKYFYQINYQDSIAPNVDYDGDGLTNYQEFLLGTNPTKADTDNDGYSDGREVLNGYNPLGDGKLTPAQEDIISKWDLQETSVRISYNVLQNLVAGPAKPSAAMAVAYNFGVNGELTIPRLGVKAPLIWSKSENNFTNDLENGVIHYPGTPTPGQVGVSYVSGHSSNYIWSKSSYSHIFSRINELNPGDEFFVTLTQADGKKVSLRYVVLDKREFQPDDQAQFESPSNTDSIMNLSTCWPLGTTARRMVVSGKLTGV